MYITTEPQRFDGYWSFSKDQSCWFSGSLKYSPESQKIELRMWGPGDSVNLDFQSDTIIGRTTDEKKITLLNCIIRESVSTGFPTDSNDKTYLHIVEAKKILIGEHYNTIDEICYDLLSIRYSNQFDFIQTDGFQNDRDLSKGRYSVNYNKPREIVLLKTNAIEIKIYFFATFGKFCKPSNESSIVQKEYFNISFNDTHNLNFLQKEINMLRNFITFSINNDVFPLECSFGINADREESKSKMISFLTSFPFIKLRQDNRNHYHNNILEIGDFQNKPDLYEKWRGLFNEKESALYKFFSTTYYQKYFLEERFHKLVMSFEDYHRNSPEYFMNQNSKMSRISLKRRIESAFEKFHKQLLYLFKDLSEKGRIVKLITCTRDFLTHGGNVRKEESVKDLHSYFALTDLLIIIITLMILNDLGFLEKVITDKIWNLPIYRDLVDKDWSVVQ